MKTKSLLAILATSLFVFSCSDDDPAAVSRNKGKKDKDKKEKVEKAEVEAASPELNILGKNSGMMGYSYDIQVKIPKVDKEHQVRTYEGEISPSDDGWFETPDGIVSSGNFLSGTDTSLTAHVATLGRSMEVVLIGHFDPKMIDEDAEITLTNPTGKAFIQLNYIFVSDLAQGIEYDFACTSEPGQTLGELRSELEQLMEVAGETSFSKIATAYCIDSNDDVNTANLGQSFPTNGRNYEQEIFANKALMYGDASLAQATQDAQNEAEKARRIGEYGSTHVYPGAGAPVDTPVADDTTIISDADFQ